MGRIWNALIDRFAWMLTPHPDPAPLTPGDCECGHYRCSHKGGRGKCQVVFDEGGNCACQVYIIDNDDDDDDDDEEGFPIPSPEELERMLR